MERNAKNLVASGGGVLGCRGFHSSFRTTQGPTRTRIFNSDSVKSLQSSTWFIHENRIPTVSRNHPSFSKYSKSDSRQHLTDLLITSGTKESTIHQTFYRNLQPQGYPKRSQQIRIQKVSKFTLEHTNIDCPMFPILG